MKVQRLTFVFAVFIFSIILTETAQHVHKADGLATQKTKDPSQNHHHHGDHKDHAESGGQHKEHSHRHLETHSHKHSQQKELVANTQEGFITAYIAEISQNKVLMVVIAVVIVSIPSFPAFLILLFISKFTSGKQKNKHLINEKYLRMMICLAIGSLTGDVFFGMMSHIIPHDHESEHNHNSGGHDHRFQPEVFCIIVGIFFFYVVDRAFGGHDHDHGHGHDHELLHADTNDQELENETKKEQRSDNGHKKKEIVEQEIRNRNSTKENKPKANEGKEKQKVSQYNADPQGKIAKANNRSAILYLVADFLHNIIDGIGIGVAFTISNSLGVTTTVAVATHELPHEIGDFAILLKKNYSLKFILLTQLSTATGALFGGLLGIYFGNFAEKYLLGFTAGGFLYLALGNMVPELLKSGAKPTFWNLLLEAGLGFLGASLIVISA